VDKIDDTYTETILTQEKTQTQNNYGIVSIVAGAAIVGVILYVRKLRKLRTSH
jgi:hypothetical protein